MPTQWRQVSVTHFKVVIIKAVGVFNHGLLFHYLPVGVGQEAIRFEHAHCPLFCVIDPANSSGYSQPSSIGDVAHPKSLEEDTNSGRINEQGQDHDTSSVEQ